jgi:hypothetical protein
VVDDVIREEREGLVPGDGLQIRGCGLEECVDDGRRLVSHVYIGLLRSRQPWSSMARTLYHYRSCGRSLLGIGSLESSHRPVHSPVVHLFATADA